MLTEEMIEAIKEYYRTCCKHWLDPGSHSYDTVELSWWDD